MAKFYGTFGIGQGGGWAVIEAADELTARAAMMFYHGREFCSIYSEKEFARTVMASPDYAGPKEVERIVLTCYKGGLTMERDDVSDDALDIFEALGEEARR